MADRGIIHMVSKWNVPSGKHTKNYGKIMKDPLFSMSKSAISTGPFSIAKKNHF